MALGAPFPKPVKIPADLLQGPVSREIKFPLPKRSPQNTDLVVADLQALPVASDQYDLAIALNVIDMLPDPVSLIQLQKRLLKAGGTLIQSCPYIWHEDVAQKLKKRIPKSISDSAKAVEWLCEEAGFKVQDRIEHLPWLFFKHLRQMEIYSVHLFRAASVSNF